MYKSGAICKAADTKPYSTMSGKFKNPGKKYFLQLESEAVRDVNKERDDQCMSYAGKAMLIYGLAKQTNGLREIRLLFPAFENHHLQVSY